MFHSFQKIEGQWPRREHFRHYMHRVRCTYSFTVQIDITKLRPALKAAQAKAYPAQIYVLASVVNRLPEFRTGMTEQGEPGHWDTMNSSYTVFHPETKTFSSIWAPYQQPFAAFYRSCTGDMRQYAGSAAFAPKGGEPPNVFSVSGVP